MPFTATVLTVSYDYRLVALSVFLAICASYAALELAGRVTEARGRVRVLWIIGGSTAMGLGIWSMHYIGMLAFRLPIPVFYDWPTVVLSLLAAILASAVALYVASREVMGAWRAVAGSILMGAAIAAMHYIGMDAMRLAAMCHYDNTLVVLSVVLAIVISFVALWLAFLARVERRGGVWRKIGSAVVMGAAIPVMHYTGMAAASFIPSGKVPNLSHAVDISALGMTGIALVTLLVLGLAILTSLFDREYSIQKDFSRGIIEGLPGIFYLIGEHGQILRWNAALSVASGYSAEEIPRMSPLDFFKEPDRGIIAERMQLALSQGTAIAEASFIAKDQTETPYLFSAQRLMFEGRPCLVALGHDITERKRAEAGLKRAKEIAEAAQDALGKVQESLRLTLLSSGIGVWSWEIEADIIEGDENLSNQFSLPVGQFPKTLQEFVALLHPDDRERIKQEIAASVERGGEYSRNLAFCGPTAPSGT
jgi:two-component system, sensor histidine kinase and response regulator